jgi:hypothetical protein
MIVATSSGRTRPARCANTSGFISRVGRPRSTTAWKVVKPGSPGGLPSMRITWSSAGHWALIVRIFPSCSSVDTKTAFAAQSLRSGAICAAGSVG